MAHRLAEGLPDCLLLSYAKEPPEMRSFLIASDWNSFFFPAAEADVAFSLFQGDPNRHIPPPSTDGADDSFEGCGSC